MSGSVDRAASQSARWCVSGRVQGVGFRWFVCQEARRLGLAGDVRNLPGGEVEVRAVGAPDALAALLASIRLGPPGAQVESVRTLATVPVPDGAAFTVRR